MFQGAIYHVNFRGVAKSNIFLDDTDHRRFLRTLEERVRQYAVRLYLYCLMLTHGHLVVETPEANLRVLADMSSYGFPADYMLRREDVVRAMTVERVRMLAAEHLDVDRMIWLIVGDARTQLGRLGGLGLGEPILLDREGRSVSEEGD